MVFPGHVWMWELDCEEGWVLKNCCFWTVVLEKTPESPGLQGDYTTQSYRKSTLTIHWKDWCWSWSSNTLVTWCKEQTHWKRSWGWERLKAKGEGDNRGWGQRMRWLDSISDSIDMNLSKFWETVEDRGAWHATIHGITKSQTWLSDWTTTTSEL